MTATVDFTPNTLSLESEGEWVTAYIELPEGYDVSDIDICSILLNGMIPVDPKAPTDIGDYDSDGIFDLMVKFDRVAVKNILTPGTQTITITGTISGVPFKGTDTITVISP